MFIIGIVFPSTSSFDVLSMFVISFVLQRTSCFDIQSTMYVIGFVFQCTFSFNILSMNIVNFVLLLALLLTGRSIYTIFLVIKNPLLLNFLSVCRISSILRVCFVQYLFPVIRVIVLCSTSVLTHEPSFVPKCLIILIFCFIAFF